MESIRPKPWRPAYASERSVRAAIKSGGWGCWIRLGTLRLPRNRCVEERPRMHGAPRVQDFQDEGKCLFLRLAGGELPAQSLLELVGPIAEHDASAGQDVGPVSLRPHGLIERPYPAVRSRIRDVLTARYPGT